MNERLAFHLLKRLRRKAMTLALADAVEAGILRREDVESQGRMLSVYHRNPDAGSRMSPMQAVAILSRHRRRLPNETRHPIRGGSEELTVDADVEPGETREGKCSDAREVGSRKRTRDDDLAMVRAIRAAAEPPRASDVAAMLLVAQAVPDSKEGLGKVLRPLRLRRPIVTVLCETRGFERTFLELLKRGSVLRGAVESSTGYDERRRSFLFEHLAAARWRIVIFTGHDHDEEDSERQIDNAALSVYPILTVTESKERLSSKLARASQLDLACGTLNTEIARRTIETVIGESPSAGKLDGIDCGPLGLSDLAIAIRHGVTADTAAESLRRLADAEDDADGGPKDGLDKATQKGKSRSSDLSPPRRGTAPGSGSDIIKPEVPSEILTGQPVPTIETLAGYGEASNWALQIRDELPLWRAGKLAWADMSTKILLSGPPGVGKTMFARALCNSLQIPLLATSVARWLEPSHLGDVLKRIRNAFAEAQAHRPCILFIDEFDGIGRRVDFLAKEYADYWNSLVNCGLEMLDGVSRTSGVIVVCATNNPSSIDPALLRSGRLERQIEIPLPDAESRLTILRHHLGADVDGVLTSAPKKAGKAELDSLLQEGMAIVSDQPYRDLVAAAIPSRSEVDAG
ncbi:ATP-binding protein [Mesorhizobium sp.]|uniref:AAA family ATPase n=1 Tax=Mesorhizobium sp. TaxID=1871066 RepID=UPI0025FF907A|nr:ATP-binding protein [Mesorhizobium sp.]